MMHAYSIFATITKSEKKNRLIVSVYFKNSQLRLMDHFNLLYQEYFSLKIWVVNRVRRLKIFCQLLEPASLGSSDIFKLLIVSGSKHFFTIVGFETKTMKLRDWTIVF